MLSAFAALLSAALHLPIARFILFVFLGLNLLLLIAQFIAAPDHNAYFSAIYFLLLFFSLFIFNLLGFKLFVILDNGILDFTFLTLSLLLLIAQI